MDGERQLVMAMDLVLIGVLMYQMFRIVSWQKGLGDFLANFLICFLGYGIVKAVPHCLLGGFTWPVNPDPNIHFFSGSISFVVCSLLLWKGRTLKERRKES